MGRLWQQPELKRESLRLDGLGGIDFRNEEGGNQQVPWEDIANVEDAGRAVKKVVFPPLLGQLYATQCNVLIGSYAIVCKVVCCRSH